jgi:hypothetical protein
MAVELKNDNVADLPIDDAQGHRHRAPSFLPV